MRKYHQSNGKEAYDSYDFQSKIVDWMQFAVYRSVSLINQNEPFNNTEIQDHVQM